MAPPTSILDTRYRLVNNLNPPPLKKNERLGPSKCEAGWRQLWSGPFRAWKAIL